MDGKIGVADLGARSESRLRAVENENGGLFRSDDGGATWTLVNNERRFRQRAFYYTHVFADPKNKDLVYVGNVGTYRSTRRRQDVRAATICRAATRTTCGSTPTTPITCCTRSDGGGAITYNASSDNRTWTATRLSDGPVLSRRRDDARAVRHLRLAAGRQRSVRAEQHAAGGFGGRGGGGGRGGAPATYSPGGSEDGYIAPDPKDPDIFYSGTNANGGGFLTKLNRRTGEVREVSPYPRMFSGEESAVLKERWQWTYPIMFSPVDPNVLYASSQHLWKTTNGGQSWERISPDLTRHDPKTMGPSGGPITRDMNGPEVYAVIFALGPSKRTTNVIWTGSDDGIISVTKDGGKTWSNVTPKDMPDFGRVSIIDASAFDSASAYVAVKRPLLDDKAPYIFRTHDFGKTWTKIVNGIRGDDFVHAVREDPTRKGLLYAATQHGVYLSYDDGDHWESLSLNLPDIPIADLIVVGPRSRDRDARARFLHSRQHRAAAAVPRRDGERSDPVLFKPADAIRASSPAVIQYVLKAAGAERSRRHPRRQGPGHSQLSGHDERWRTRVAAAAAARAPDSAAVGGGGGGRGRGGFGTANPGKNAGSQHVHVGSALCARRHVPRHDSLGRRRRTDRRRRPGNTRCDSPPTARRCRSRSSSSAIHCTRRPTPICKRSSRSRSRLRDKVSEANGAVIQIRDVKREVADRLGKSHDAQLKSAGDKFDEGLERGRGGDLSGEESERAGSAQLPDQSQQSPCGTVGRRLEPGREADRQRVSDIHGSQIGAQGADGFAAEGAQHRVAAVQHRGEARGPRADHGEAASGLLAIGASFNVRRSQRPTPLASSA